MPDDREPDDRATAHFAIAEKPLLKEATWAALRRSANEAASTLFAVAKVQGVAFLLSAPATGPATSLAVTVASPGQAPVLIDGGVVDMDVLEQGTNLYERCREGMRSPNLLRRMTVPGTRGALAAVVAAGLVALLLVAGNVPGGPVPAASASSSDGSLSGTVTEAGNAGTIAPAVCVYAAAQGGPPSYNTTTAANGSYQFADIAAGQYSVWFDPTCKGAQTSPYATQYYDDVPDISAATWVTVPGGGSVGGIDADLALAGTISGLVSGPSGPLQGVCVIAYDSVDGDEVGATTTASNGGYSVQLPPGGYLVQFDPTCRAVNTYACRSSTTTSPTPMPHRRATPTWSR